MNGSVQALEQEIVKIARGILAGQINSRDGQRRLRIIEREVRDLRRAEEREFEERERDSPRQLAFDLKPHTGGVDD